LVIRPIRLGLRLGIRNLAPLPDDTRRLLLCHRIPLRIQLIGDPVQLPMQQRFDPLGQRPPLRLGYIEMATQVQNRALAHPLGAT
jgi:hypothetical protein